MLALVMALVLTVQDEFPQHTGFVNDFASVIDEKSKRELTELLGKFAQDKDTHLIIVTVKSLNGMSVEDYANKLFRKWGVGEKGKNNGILFLNAPKERKLRIEIGKGLEGRFTDIDSKMILDNIVRPEFKAGKTGEGFLKGSRAIIEKMTTSKDPPQENSIGAPAPPKSKPNWTILLIILGIIIVGAIVFFAYMKSQYSYGSSDDSGSLLGGFLGGLGSSSSSSGGWSSGSSSSDDSSSSSSDDSSSSFSGGDSGGGGSSSDY